VAALDSLVSALEEARRQIRMMQGGGAERVRIDTARIAELEERNTLLERWLALADAELEAERKARPKLERENGDLKSYAAQADEATQRALERGDRLERELREAQSKLGHRCREPRYREALERALPIIEYVSRGKGFVGVAPYPDALARIVNAEAHQALGEK
jgi:chromosome segregation ATPase